MLTYATLFTEMCKSSQVIFQQVSLSLAVVYIRTKNFKQPNTDFYCLNTVRKYLRYFIILTNIITAVPTSFI